MIESHDSAFNNIKLLLPKKVGEKVAELRKLKGFSQTDLAKQVGKDRQYLYKIEKGIVTVNIVTLGILCNALEISLSDFFQDI